MRRDFSLKPRTTGDLPAEKLEQILSRIYPEETVAELMEKLCDTAKPGEIDFDYEAED